MDTKSKAIDISRDIAIAALNEAHGKHGLKKILNCDFCTSLAAEMTIARHYEPVIQAYLTQCQEVERLKGLMLEQTKLNARVIKERDMWKEAADTTLQKYEAAMKKIDRALKDKQ